MKKIEISYGELNDKSDVLQSSNYKENKSHLQICGDVTEAVGKVPVVKINNISQICSRQNLLLKLEACNPGGSIKEKNAVFLIKDAAERGILPPGGTIIESSSGNFGIGLAMVGAAKGYKVIIVVDAKTPPPVRRMLEAYGASLVDVPLSAMDENGSMQKARMKRAEEISQEIPGSWYVCQHLNPLNPVAHNVFTANEIDEVFGNNLDIVVVGISTSGQLAGIASFLRKKRTRVKIIGVDVAGSSILGTPVHSYKMTGLGLSFIPPAFKSEYLDGAYSVSDQLAFSICRELAKNEGLLLGASTGAIVGAGLNYASTLPEGKNILMINPDRGDRYLETIYNDEWIKKQNLVLLKEDKLLKEIDNLQFISKDFLERHHRAN